ncbi:hypothetical protein C4D60_Mb11t14260 [Musa balbisiana]|uniref:Succinate dehydrogenase subunit 3 n=1 Tax=Musa balbisiana TaxID=52838 RepID=A0A4S8J5K2_MUSBA|nr:hypothetical protein C4D60_Mb11t14260 [Musa balbisiana]
MKDLTDSIDLRPGLLYIPSDRPPSLRFFSLDSGFLSGTSVYSRMDGGCQKLQSLEPPRGCRTIMKLPYGCSFLPENSQPMSSIHGSRGVHVTRTLSESTRGVVSNRPLSPHLPVKKPQLSATFSISHRIFGASLASAILLIPIAWKFSLLLDLYDSSFISVIVHAVTFIHDDDGKEKQMQT